MEKTFDSLSTYIALAKKTISKFAPKFYNGLSKEMLSNEEAVSDVATAIMYADWRFDPDRPGKTGLKKTLYSYRNQCAIWAIKTYITNKYKKPKNISINHVFSEDSESELHNTIPDKKTKQPIDVLIEEENETILSDAMSALWNHSALSEKQKHQLKLYYLEDKTLTEIGKVYGVSREAIRQNIKRSLETIRQYDKCTT
jgi:RNA polymerase sigma factor (sigma-70 family)